MGWLVGLAIETVFGDLLGWSHRRRLKIHTHARVATRVATQADVAVLSAH
jgi:hypothetical protein